MKPTVVIKLGGAAVEEQAITDAVIEAIAFLVHNYRVVLVHGGGKQVDAHLAQWQLPVEKRNGLRVTPLNQMPVISGVLAGMVNKQLVATARRFGLTAVGLSLADGAMVNAHPHPDTALGAVGVVEPGDGALLRSLLGGGYLPIISSIACDDHGHLLNVNADDAAVAVARSLGALQLVLLSDVSGVKNAAGQVEPLLSVEQIYQLIESGVVHGGMTAKVLAALQAAQQLGAPVVIASFHKPQDLLRLLAGEAVGTTVLPATHADAASSDSPDTPDPRRRRDSVSPAA